MTADKNYHKGIILIICSALCFSLMAAFVRLSGNINFLQKGFFRNFISFLIALITVIKQYRKEGGENLTIKKEWILFLLLRSAAGTIGILGNFYAIDRLILSDAGMLNKMAPFWTLLFSLILMGEKVRLVPGLCISAAFAGTLLIIKPSFDFSQMIPSAAGFVSGIGAGFAYACVRKLGKLKCHGKIVVLFFSAFSTITLIPNLILNFEPMTLTQTLLLIMAGVCAAGGQFTITAAYYHAPASKISIFDFSQIIFSTALGFILFSQKPDMLSIFGYITIVSMAVLNFLWNAKFQNEKKS